jgi:histidinol phosphatase-like PHP family hydrolase
VAKADLTNAQLADLLAQEGKRNSGILARAYGRAARSAFLWPEAVTEVLANGGSLLDLHGVGPFIARNLTQWVNDPPTRRPQVPPERRDFLTMADARTLLIKNPAWAKRLRGDLQMHTTWSDGSGTIAEMAEAGQTRGYEYIAVTDHSKGLKIAGGIDEAQLTKQGEEIERTNAIMASGAAGLTVLRSIELNLNPRGEGDMDKRCLAKLDLVLGSFHSALRVKDDQTPRYLSGVRNPSIQILGHPRGRIYNYRLGLKADWARVFAEAARLNKALEIDCYPDRQDLNLSLLKIARAEGVRISLGTDAHHPWQLEFITLGLAAALKAKIPAERIVNFMSLGELRRWVKGVRQSASVRRLSVKNSNRYARKTAK